MEPCQIFARQLRLVAATCFVVSATVAAQAPIKTTTVKSDAGPAKRGWSLDGCDDEKAIDFFHKGSVAFLGDGGAAVTADLIHICVGEPNSAAAWGIPFAATVATKELAKGSAAPPKANALSIIDPQSASMGFALAPSASYGATSFVKLGPYVGARQNALKGDSTKGSPDRQSLIVDFGGYIRVETDATAGTGSDKNAGRFWIQATYLGMNGDVGDLRAAGLIHSTGHERGMSAEIGVHVDKTIDVKLTYLRPLSDGLKSALTAPAFRMEISQPIAGKK